VERAAREIGGTIAHGYLTQSLVPLLDDQIMEVTGWRAVELGGETKPVCIAESITLDFAS